MSASTPMFSGRLGIWRAQAWSATTRRSGFTGQESSPVYQKGMNARPSHAPKLFRVAKELGTVPCQDIRHTKGLVGVTLTVGGNFVHSDAFQDPETQINPTLGASYASVKSWQSGPDLEGGPGGGGVRQTGILV